MYFHSIDRLKSNSLAQLVIAIFFYVTFIAYIFSYIWSLSDLAYNVSKNTSLLLNHEDLQIVTDFTLNSDNTISFNTLDGSGFENKNCNLAYFEDTDSNSVYYSASDNYVLFELPDNYIMSFMFHTDFLFVSLIAILINIALYLTRNSGFVVLSEYKTRCLFLLLLSVICLVGVLTGVYFLQ